MMKFVCVDGGIHLLPLKLPFLGTPWNHNEGGKCDFRKHPGGWSMVITIARRLSKGSRHSVLIQGSVVVIRQFLIFINQTFLMVSVALVTMVD